MILHGYGGAKKEMPTSLAKLAKLGWIPMATAMVGSTSSPPLWTGNDWRPILGTSVDTRILPPPLRPHDDTLRSLPCKYCIVNRGTMELREHFGACEHSYGHWIDLDMPHGRFPLWQILRQYPEVAHPQCRDIAPLRLVSWVSCEVPARVQQVLNQLMILFGAVTPASSNEVLEIGLQQLGVTASGELSWDMIRDAWRQYLPY